MKYLSSVLLFVLLLGTMFSSCSETDNNGKNNGKKELISDSTMQLLQIDTVRLIGLNEEVKLSGQVSFDENRVVKVYPFSSGQVLSVNTSIGDYVKAGQKLATIRSADIASNYSDLAAAGNDIAIARRAMDNAEHLFKNGIASEREYVEAKENYSKSVSNANKIKQQLLINGGGRTSPDGTYVIVAPRSGYVVERMINPGNYIRNDNSSSLFTIGDISDVWIWANVFETDVAKVKEGYTAIVRTIAYPDSVFTGKVDKINEVLDPVTKVMKVKIVLSNKNGLLKPEMFANIKIISNNKREVLAVPSSAVISEYGKNYVVLFNNKNDVKIQEVVIDKTIGNNTSIISGVSKGQRLITRNQILVYRKLMEN